LTQNGEKDVFVGKVAFVCPSLTVAPDALPGGTVRTHYTQTLAASGGSGPYSYSVSLGSVPSGLTLDADGLLAGTPTVGGITSFDVTATDINNCTGTTTYSLDIAGVGPALGATGLVALVLLLALLGAVLLRRPH
jgi:hypothetical protein